MFATGRTVRLTTCQNGTVTSTTDNVSYNVATILGLSQIPLTRYYRRTSTLNYIRVYGCGYPNRLIVNNRGTTISGTTRLTGRTNTHQYVPLGIDKPFRAHLVTPTKSTLTGQFTTRPFNRVDIPILFGYLNHRGTRDSDVPTLLIQRIRDDICVRSALRHLNRLNISRVLRINPNGTLSNFIGGALPNIAYISIRAPTRLSAILGT